MTDLTESSTFEPAVVQLETSTPALGGPGGPLNAQAQALANRTRYLKDQKADIRALPIGTSLEYSGTSLPPGFLWEDGSNVSRTTYAALFSAIGTTYGEGNGSTTFALPDSRGRVAVGRDDMGGAAANRITGSSGITGTTLGAAGGNQLLQSHTHAVNDAGHTHGINDPGHAHSVADPGHAHGMFDQLGLGGTNTSERWYDCGLANTIAGPKGTDVAGTGIGIFGAGTGIWNSASGTGISLGSQGGGSSQNVQPSIVKNKIIYTGVFA